MNAPDTPDTFPCARFIKEIGRGPNGARSLSPEDTRALFSAMLDGRVPDLELGAILLAYRLKGETADELSAMLAATHASFAPLTSPACGYRAVSIPSYNGARKQPNLVPLLALLLAREGVPVLVHGVSADPGRVTSAEIFAALNLPAARDHAEIEAQLAARRVAFAPIEALAPKLARLLALRRRMGVRNSTHTLVKLLQPFAQPGLRLVNYTHPPYRDSLSALFAAHPEAAAGGALLARGTEGDRVRGLELGADDYVTKPFSPRELVLRARSVLRRARPAAAEVAETPAPRVRKVGDLTLDAAGHRATKAGRPLSLTSREFDLLAFFADNPGQVFTRTELMRQVWGWEYGDESTVTVHVRRLREKIEDDPHQPKMIVTIWGVGYRFDPEGPDGDAAAEPPAGGREAGS